MAFLRLVPYIGMILLLGGCDDRALEKRTAEIKAFSANEDRMYMAQSLARIQRTYWTLRDHAWLGKTRDGTLVRLNAPHATVAPLPSRAFYSGWQLQMTISSEDWRTYPATPHDGPFVVVYAITRHNLDNWNIEVSDGVLTEPLKKGDLAALEGE